MANHGVAAQARTYRDLFAEKSGWRFTAIGAAALGFLSTFLLLAHEIRAFKDLLLPLLAIVPIYLVLTSLNMWWAARSAARISRRPRADTGVVAKRTIWATAIAGVCGFTFGVAMAVWYIHSVSS